MKHRSGISCREDNGAHLQFFEQVNQNADVMARRLMQTAGEAS
jgi:hypothetical protein